MLIEQRLRALALLLLVGALRLAAAELRAIGVGLLCRGFLRGALPESIQIDDFTSHARLHHAKTAGKERQRRAKIVPIAIQESPYARI